MEEDGIPESQILIGSERVDIRDLSERLLKTAMGLTSGDLHTAKDLAQDVLATLCEQHRAAMAERDAGRSPGRSVDNPGAYVYRMLVNRYIRQVWRSRMIPADPTGAALAASTASAGQYVSVARRGGEDEYWGDLADFVGPALECLSRREAEVFRLLYDPVAGDFNSLTRAKAAEILGTTPGAVKTALNTVRNKLKDYYRPIVEELS